MINPAILLRLQPKLDMLNSKQRLIATDIIASDRYSIIDHFGEICIKTDQGELFKFVDFVRSICKCS